MFARNSKFTHLRLFQTKLSKPIIDRILAFKSLVNLQIQREFECDATIYVYHLLSCHSNRCTMTVTWKQLSEILGEYVGTSGRVTPKFFDYLTKLVLYRDFDEASYDEDPRLVSYLLAHARRLNSLRFDHRANMDREFTLQLIGALLEELVLCRVSDVTIDVLCHQLAHSLQRLTLFACLSVSRQGLFCAERLLRNITNVST